MAEDAERTMPPVTRLRIAVDELPPRDSPRTATAIDPALGRLGAPEGSPCQLDCDCRIGLVCTEGICSEKE